MRSLIQRLKKKKMIEVRVATTRPHHNHPYRSVSIISIVNYDKFQQFDLTPDQLKSTSSALLNNNLSNNTNLIGSANDGNSGYKVVETWGDEDIVEREGKRYKRHRWKKTPMIPL